MKFVIIAIVSLIVSFIGLMTLGFKPQIKRKPKKIKRKPIETPDNIDSIIDAINRR